MARILKRPVPAGNGAFADALPARPFAALFLPARRCNFVREPACNRRRQQRRPPPPATPPSP
ncbi:MAG: hypothetical protein LBR07_03175 [Puniceicoccales bacterium]|nr:hypothetical protein [Puniceicoccales bacterium]